MYALSLPTDGNKPILMARYATHEMGWQNADETLAKWLDYKKLALETECARLSLTAQHVRV